MQGWLPAAASPWVTTKNERVQTGHRPDPRLAQTTKASRLSSICDTESLGALPNSGCGHISSAGCQVCFWAPEADESPADSKGATSPATSKSQTELPALARNPTIQLLPVTLHPTAHDRALPYGMI